MRLTGCVEDGNGTISVQLDFKNEVRGTSNGDLALSAIIGGTNSGKAFSGMLTGISRQEYSWLVKLKRLTSYTVDDDTSWSCDMLLHPWCQATPPHHTKEHHP